MFAKAQEKIKNWWANPSWAPLTEPLKYIAGAACAPNANFIKGMRRAANDENYYGDDKKKPVLARMFKEWSADIDQLGTWLSSTIGAVCGGIAAASVAGVAAASAGAAWPLISAAAIVGCGAGFVATPFIIMGALAFGGATLGAVASPWAIGKGIIKAVKHRQFQKTQAAVVQATPPLQAAGPDARETATRIFTTLRDLPADIQGPVLKSLAEKFAASGNGAADQIMKAVEALPDAEREALVKNLRSVLAPSFEAVADKEAGDSVILQKDASTMPTLRLKSRVA